MIETNHGIQLPALIHSIVETFGRKGADQTSCNDKSFMKWLNGKLLQKSPVINDETPSQIGKGVGVQLDYSGETDSNKDPFVLLVPAKGI